MARQQHARRATLRRALDMTRSGFGPAVAVLALMSGLAALVSAVAILFVSENGKLTRSQPNDDYPGVAMVTGPPTAALGSLEFQWL